MIITIYSGTMTVWLFLPLLLLQVQVLFFGWVCCHSVNIIGKSFSLSSLALPHFPICSIFNFAFPRFLFPSAIIIFTCSLSSVLFTVLRPLLFLLHFHYFSHVIFFMYFLFLLLFTNFCPLLLLCFVFVCLWLNLGLNYF